MTEKKVKKFEDTLQCPVRNVLDRIGDKWSILILLSLHEQEILRFNELFSLIGNISHKMLSSTLKSLEADNLIERKSYPVIPPKVEYSLTIRGKSLMPHIHNLVKWANLNFDEIMFSRQTFEKGA